MKPADLIRRLRRLASRRGWEIQIREGGKHTRVTLNGRQTTVPRHAADLGTGLLSAIRKQLGLSPEDLEN
jgi:predicted RNA binding protein YcfA (HicA-like mRNA interferase family)